MWMVEPKIMCRQHLLGEHLECHMLVGALQKGISFDGFIKSNCVQLVSIEDRHNELMKEMENRGYRHKSKMDFDYSLLDTYDEVTVNYEVDKKQSLELLLSRCQECKKRASEIGG